MQAASRKLPRDWPARGGLTPREVPMDLDARLRELSKLDPGGAPVVSVYLNTRWTDEHQRERARVFLKNELRRARTGDRPEALAADLDWIEEQGAAVVSQEMAAAADGVALFACQAAGLRAVLPVRAPFEDAFVVAQAPYLRPLVELADGAPEAIVVLVHGERARLVPLTREGTGEEVVLESEVPGRHRRGGWAQLAQSRYQRHIQDHRGRHFDAVVEALGHLAQAHPEARVVLAGEPRVVAAFRRHLPEATAAGVAGTIAGEWHEPAAALAGRAAALVALRRESDQVAALEGALTEAAKGGRAAAGLDAVLAAVVRGAVHRLYIARGFAAEGAACRACGVLTRSGGPCEACGGATVAVELGEAVIERVVAQGGSVEMLPAHAGLAQAGGVAAQLRYPV
jgi:peptide chain release factor subunit 1